MDASNNEQTSLSNDITANSTNNDNKTITNGNNTQNDMPVTPQQKQDKQDDQDMQNTKDVQDMQNAQNSQQQQTPEKQVQEESQNLPQDQNSQQEKKEPQTVIASAPRVFNVPVHSVDRDNEILIAMQKRKEQRTRQQAFSPAIKQETLNNQTSSSPQQAQIQPQSFQFPQLPQNLQLPQHLQHPQSAQLLQQLQQAQNLQYTQFTQSFQSLQPLQYTQLPQLSQQLQQQHHRHHHHGHHSRHHSHHGHHSHHRHSSQQNSSSPSLSIPVFTPPSSAALNAPLAPNEYEQLQVPKPKKVRKSRSPKPPTAIESFTDPEKEEEEDEKKSKKARKHPYATRRKTSARLRGVKDEEEEEKEGDEKKGDLFGFDENGLGRDTDELSFDKEMDKSDEDDDKIIDRFIKRESRRKAPKASSYEELRELRIQRNKKLLDFLNVNDILNGIDDATNESADADGDGDGTPSGLSPQKQQHKKKNPYESLPALRMSLRHSDNPLADMLSEDAQEKEGQLHREQERNAASLAAISGLIRAPQSPASPGNSASSTTSTSLEPYCLVPPKRTKRETQRISAKAQRERSKLTALASQLAVDPSTAYQAHATRILTLSVLDRADVDVVASGSISGDVSIAHVALNSSSSSSYENEEEDASVPVYKARPHQEGKAVSAVAFSPSGTSLYSAGYDGALMRLDIETGKYAPLLSARPKVSLSAMALRRDDPHVAYCGTAAGGVVVVDERMAQDSPVAALGCHGTRIMSLETHPVDPAVLVSGSYDGTAALWDLRVLLARVRNTRRAPDIASIVGRSPTEVRGCIAAYACEGSTPLVAATVSPFSEMAESPLMVATTKGTVALWTGVKAVLSSTSLARNRRDEPDFTLNNPNGSPSGPVYFHPVWSPHHDGLAAVGCVNRTVSLFGFLPRYMPSPFKVQLKSKGLINDIPVVNVFHPRRDWSLFSGTADGYVYHWTDNLDNDGGDGDDEK